jgi:DNA processing protein
LNARPALFRMDTATLDPIVPQEEREARILFSLCPLIGPARFRRLQAAFGSAVGAWKAGPSGWGSVEGFTLDLAQGLAREAESARGRWEKDRPVLEKAGVRAVMPADDEWPSGLKSLEDAPYILYMRGRRRPADEFSVAVVGTRRPSPYGRSMAERLARELTEAGICVVSGLARGIDTAAHQSALKAGGRPIGVLGSGFGRFYPQENAPLADRMTAQGAVVTEFPWDTEPRPENFPRRNRIITGMSLGVVVVEADVKSGALITAALAARQGRDVFAVPGSVFSPGSRGPHLLLKQGAKPVEDAEDVLEAITFFRPLMRLPVKKPPAARPDLSENEKKVMSLLSWEPSGRDSLASGSALVPGVLSAVLLGLEMKGLTRALPGGAYVLTDLGTKG